jgi:hypothetical protein
MSEEHAMTPQDFLDSICWDTQDLLDELETLRAFAELIAEVRAVERARCATIAHKWAMHYGAGKAGEACVTIRGEIERGGVTTPCSTRRQ